MSKPLTIQYTGKYANHLLREKDKEIERMNNIINKTIKYCEESSMTLKSHYFEDVIKLLKGEICYI